MPCSISSTATISFFSQAMDEYEEVEQTRLRCFKECEENSPGSYAGFENSDVQLRFFLQVTDRGSCIRRCKEAVLGLLPWGGVSHYVLEQLQNKEGYNYLQLSLYKVWSGL